MDIGYRGRYYGTEYILPCVVNVLSEDDIILEFGISNNIGVSMVYLFGYFNANYSLF